MKQQVKCYLLLVTSLRQNRRRSRRSRNTEFRARSQCGSDPAHRGRL